ncbi:tetratricopeptide repeat protein [Terasakiella pusilla]|uniref:tetratricopeptide repeat protein n=1 Tax=Terasakiella pusilla TaxID=64973 RepID=UPI003AA923BD
MTKRKSEPALSNNSWDALMVLAFFLIDAQRAEKALSILKGMHHINDQDAQVHKLLAYGHFQNGDGAQALFHIEQVYKLSDEKEDIDGLEILRARALASQGELQKAQDILERINKG